MKSIIIIIACLLSSQLHAQNFYFSFEPSGTPYQQFLTIDTSYHNNKWCIGAPHKTTFNFAVTDPNVLVTDTSLPYCAGDTSVFILKMPKWSIMCGGYATLSKFQFLYWIDKAYDAKAILEISEDSGAHWINVHDSLPRNYTYDEWGIPFPQLASGFSVFSVNRATDTLHDSAYFRFTFIGGDNPGGKDGWMIDNINVQYSNAAAGISQAEHTDLISVYPNPSNGNIYILSARPAQANASIIVYDINGREVYRTTTISASAYINMSLAAGAYTLWYATGGEYCTKRVVIEN